MGRLVLLVLLLSACKPDGYHNNYLSFTYYSLKDYDKHKTPNGVEVYSNQPFDATHIDEVVDGLEVCLEMSIRRDWFVVLIPDDWFESACSGEQLIPYAANPALCRAKGIEIAEECEWVSVPTEECACPCNWRVATQEDYIIVTPPNLRLFAAELSRMVTGINNPWTDDNILECL